MTFAKRFGISAALEEIQQEAAAAAQSEEAAAAAAAEETPAATEEETVEIPLVEDSVEEAMGETEVASAEVDAAEQTIETVQEDAQTLSDIADKMEEAEQTGGLDAAGAAVAQVAVEHLMNRLGIEGIRAMPAMESFGGDSSRSKATRLAVENIREQLKNVAKAIIAMVQKAYDFIKNYVKAALNANTRLKARAEALAAALEKVKGVAKTDKVEGGFVSALAIDGKVDAKAALTATSELLDAATVLSSQLFAAVKPAEIIDTIIDPEKFTAFEFKGIESDKLKEISGGENGYKNYALAGVTLPGDRQIVVTTKKDAEAGQESMTALANTKVGLMTGEAKEVKEAEVLSIEEAKAVAAMVIKQCDKVAELTEQSKSVETYLKEMINEVKKASSALKDDAGSNARAKAAQRVVVSMSSTATRPFVLASKVALGTSKAALDYAAKSAKAFGVQEAKEEPTDAAPAAA